MLLDYLLILFVVITVASIFASAFFMWKADHDHHGHKPAH